MALRYQNNQPKRRACIFHALRAFISSRYVWSTALFTCHLSCRLNARDRNSSRIQTAHVAAVAVGKGIVMVVVLGECRRASS